MSMDEQLDAKLVQRMKDSKARNVTLNHSASVPDFYANHVHVVASLFDINLNFGLVRKADDEEVVVDDIATVRMSPQHAKSLAGLLRRKVKDYEDEFGPLPAILDNAD
jgi:hypothetical protein